MEVKSNISVIIPIYRLNELEIGLLKNAVKSINDQILLPDSLIFVIPADGEDIAKIISELEINKGIEVKIIRNEGETDVCSQINLGVENVTTKFFSFLELDDEYSKIWLKNAVEYIKAYPEVSVFLPLIVDVTQSGGFIGFTNEAVWANQFSDELGFLDLNSLLTYQNFNIDGMVMDTEVYKEHGGLKSKIILTFIYEFLLRLAHFDVKMMTIPRFGYKHVNQREGSLFSEYKKTLSPDETKWWLAQAKKEYYFDYNREIKSNK